MCRFILKFIKNMRKKAFTLAEMLVVLAVIGTISMLTIPTLVMTNQDKEITDILLSVYKKIEISLMIDTISNFDISSFQFSAIDKNYNAKQFSQILSGKLKIMEYCDQSSECGFKSTVLNNGYKLRLVNGSSILINEDFRGQADPADRYNPILGAVYIDVNGPKGMNKGGNDQFGFYTTRKGLIPMGGPKDGLTKFSDCPQINGFACTAWLLLNKNTDYKRCPNVLNWETRITCSQ